MKRAGMKAVALDALNQRVDGGKERTREEWQRWAERNNPLTHAEKRAGFTLVVSFFPDTREFPYYRINTAGMPQGHARHRHKPISSL